MREHKGVELVTEILTPDFRKKLETLAGVNEEDIKITDRGFKFEFKNSLGTNQFQAIRYHDKVLVEFRKKSDNLIEGRYNKLVHEDVIQTQEVYDRFEKITGIYLSYA